MRHLALDDVVAEIADPKGTGGQRAVGFGGKAGGARRGHHGRGAGLDGVGAGLGQSEQVVVASGVGELEAGHPAHGLRRVVPGPAQPLGQRAQFGRGRDAVEAAEADVDRVDRPAAQQFHDRVAGLLEPQAAFDVGAPGACEVDDAVAAEEVGRVQQVDVQGLALDPLPAVQQPAQRRQLPVHDDAAGVLDRSAGAHLVGDRADPAHPGGDVGRLGVGASAQERLEEARRFVDLQPGLGDLAAVACADAARPRPRRGRASRLAAPLCRGGSLRPVPSGRPRRTRGRRY